MHCIVSIIGISLLSDHDRCYKATGLDARQALLNSMRIEAVQ